MRCKICAKFLSSTKKRLGVQSCNACAGFFRRSFSAQENFVCEKDGNCLREASPHGKACNRCRFDKCKDLGMELPPSPNKALPQACENAKVYAQTIDSLLQTTVNYPNLFELYLIDETPSLLNITLEVVKHVRITERINYLTILFNKYPIENAELHILCQICLCKFEQPWLSELQQIRIKELRQIAKKRIEKEGMPEKRIMELETLANHCLNIFKALLHV